MQYSQETIEKLAKIAEEKGEYGAVAGYLDIHPTTLNVRRKECPILDNALKTAIKKHLANNSIPDDHEFSVEELEDITKIVSEKNVDAAARKHGGRADKFFRMRKSNPTLEAAIVKGQKLRKTNTVFHRAMSLFGSFDVKQLREVTDIAFKGGLEAVEKEYGFAAHSLNKCRKKLPELDKAIKAGLRKRPIGAAVVSANKANKERKPPKPYKKKDKFKKPPREIVDKTMLAIEENSTAAWENFRKIVEERKTSEHLKKARKGDYSDMIGL